MFHCNGWCFPWTVTALAGTHICLRKTEPGPIYSAIMDHGVTHMCGAPVVMGMLVNASSQEKRSLPQLVKILTAGAAPPSAILEQIVLLYFSLFSVNPKQFFFCLLLHHHEFFLEHLFYIP